MSKRVLIIIAAGFLAIIAGIFLLKYELSNQEPDETEDLDEVEQPEIITENEKDKPGTDAGTETA
jgi:hypothetical protein